MLPKHKGKGGELIIALGLGKPKHKMGMGMHDEEDMRPKHKMDKYLEEEGGDYPITPEMEMAAEELMDAIETKDTKSFIEAFCALTDMHLAREEKEHDVMGEEYAEQELEEGEY